MKYKKGDCFLGDITHWGIAVIVDDPIKPGNCYSNINAYYPIIWTGLVGKGPFDWAESSLDNLRKATKLHRIIIGLDLENDTMYNGEKEQT